MVSKSSVEQQRILQLARAGEPATLAALLNHRLQPRGITASARWHGSELRVTLVAQPAPEQAATVPLIEQAIAKLNIPTLDVLVIAGCTPDRTQPVWQLRRQVGAASLVADLLTWLEAGTSEPPVELPLAVSPASEAEDGSTRATVPTAIDDRKFLRFQLQLENSLLLAVDSIQEILQLAISQILPVPDMPASVLGIYNWRGEMLWLIDLNALLGLGSVWDLTADTLSALNAIVLRVEQQNLAFVVEQVDGIESCAPDALHAPQGLFPPNLAPFVEGYLREAGSIALDAQAIARAPRVQFGTRGTELVGQG